MINEILSNRFASEIRDTPIDKTDKIKPKHEMSFTDLIDAVKQVFDNLKPDFDNDMTKHSGLQDYKNEDLPDMYLVERKSTPEKDQRVSVEERKEIAKWGKGKWSGEPGDSVFTPDKPEAKDALRRFGQEGIRYEDGNPDFSKVSVGTVKIDNMTSDRPSNYSQANKELSKQWNESSKDNRTDWTARDVDNWRKENHYSKKRKKN